MNPYFHVLDGRLRIKVPEIKGMPSKAVEVERRLTQLQGVTHVRANPTTGSVLVLFESGLIGPEQIVQTLWNLGCLTITNASFSQTSSAPGMGKRVAESVLSFAFETAVRQVILALI